MLSTFIIYIWFLWSCLFSFYLNKTEIGNICMSHVIFFRSKKPLFGGCFFMLPLCSHFYIKIYKLILLFFRFEFAQESKKFWKMDKIDVQKSNRRNLFVKNRRALGNLRNFFRSIFM